MLNVTIDKYCHAAVRRGRGGDPILRSLDLDAESGFSNADKCPEVFLHALCLQRLQTDFGVDLDGLELVTWADAPKGSGLGTSSTLIVALLEALREMYALDLNDYELAELAWTIERVDGGQSGGRQDQYAATFGGFNAIEFNSEKTIVNPLRLTSALVRELEASLLLFHTGTSRVSSTVISDQISAYKRDDATVVQAATQLKKDALDMQAALVTGNLRDFGQILARSWEAKKKTSSSVANADIDRAMAEALKAGAEAGKVSGAGGGGFMMFFMNPEIRSQVQRALSALGFGSTETCKFTKEGAVAWSVN